MNVNEQCTGNERALNGVQVVKEMSGCEYKCIVNSMIKKNAPGEGLQFPEEPAPDPDAGPIAQLYLLCGQESTSAREAPDAYAGPSAAPISTCSVWALSTRLLAAAGSER